jgi:hypothetical protein
MICQVIPINACPSFELTYHIVTGIEIIYPHKMKQVTELLQSQSIPLSHCIATRINTFKQTQNQQENS